MGKFKDKNGYTRLSTVKLAEGKDSTDVVAGIAGAYGAVGQISNNLKSANTMDERGNPLGEVSGMSNTLAGAGAGAKLGSVLGPKGAAIGAAVGGLYGGISSLFADTPSTDDMTFKENQFQMGKHVGSMLPEDAFAKQQLMAKDGMDVQGGNKEIEVERDEIVLRKRGKSFVKVADFKGAKTHEQGGVDYEAKKGDVIMPGKHRNKVNSMLRNRKWGAIESLRLTLPKDTGQENFADGTESVDPKTKKKFSYKDMLRDVSKNKGIKSEDFLEYQKIVRYLESKGDYSAVQQPRKGFTKAPGRGAYQYETDSDGGSGSGATAINRTKKWMNDNNYEMPEGLNSDFSKMSEELQNASDLANFRYGPKGDFDKIKSKDYKSLYLDHHWAGPKEELDKKGSYYDDSVSYMNKNKKTVAPVETEKAPVQTGGPLANIKSEETKKNPLLDNEYLQPQKYREGTSGVETDPKPNESVVKSIVKFGEDGIKFGEDGVNISEYLFNSLVNNGLTKIAAKGFIVNLAYESNDFKNLEEIGTNVHGTKGLGLAQWTDSPSSKRRTAFEKYLKDNDATVDDLDANIGFLMSELKGEQGYNVGLNLKSLNKASSVKEAANIVLTKFERPQDQSEEHLEKRLKRSSKFLEESENYVDPKPEEVKEEKQKIEELDEAAEFWKGQKAVRHRGLGAGKKAFEKNEKARENLSFLGRVASPEQLAKSGEEVTYVDKLNFFFDETATSAAMGLAYAGNQLVDFATGTNSQDSFDELKFEDTPEGDALKKEYQDIIFETIDDEDMLSLAGLTDTANFMSKFSTNLLTGQTTSGTDLYRGANLLSMYSPEDVKNIKAKLKEKGISKEGMFLFDNMAENPQNYYSSNIKGADAIDTVSMLLTPVGTVRGAVGLARATPMMTKKSLRAGKAGIDNTIQATKWTHKQAKIALKYLKDVDWKSVPKRLWDNFGKMIEDAPTYAKGEDVMDILTKAEEVLKKSKDPRASNLIPAIKKHKTTYQKAKELAKTGSDYLGKKLLGSSFSDMADYKKKVFDTTGVPWDELKNLSKRQIAGKIKVKGEKFQANLAKTKQDITDNWTSYKAKKKELIDIYESSAVEVAKNNPIVVALEKDLSFIEKSMDKLDGTLQAMKKETPLAYDKDFNLLDVEVIGKDGKVSGYKSEASSLYTKNLNEIDELALNYQSLEQLKDAKTLDAYDAAVESGQSLIKKSEKALHAETKSKAGTLLGKNNKSIRDIKNLGELRDNFPAMYNSLEKADKIKGIPKNAIGFKKFMDVLSNEMPEEGVITDEADPKETEVKEGELRKKASKLGDDIEPYKGTINTDLEGKVVLPPKEGEVPPPSDKPSIFDKANSTLSGIAAYAPAIYNIAKGTGTASKVERNYVNPALEEYENNSQAQLNSIDQAFDVAIGNSRNLSGGLASSFRSNVERSHADKLNRTAQVNAQETQVAVGVAGRNVGRVNEGKKINSQIDTQADQMDMRAEAARDSFLGQGISDLANITAVRSKDKAAKANQDKVYDLMMKNNKRTNTEG